MLRSWTPTNNTALFCIDLWGVSFVKYASLLSIGFTPMFRLRNIPIRFNSAQMSNWTAMLQCEQKQSHFKSMRVTVCPKSKTFSNFTNTTVLSSCRLLQKNWSWNGQDQSKHDCDSCWCFSTSIQILNSLICTLNEFHHANPLNKCFQTELLRELGCNSTSIWMLKLVSVCHLLHC